MSLNFPLHHNIRSYTGVDITHVRGNEGHEAAWEIDCRAKCERWSRNFMSLADSPYQSLELLMKTKFIAYSNRLNRTNTFQWELTKLNFMGSDLYNSKLPWVIKVRTDGNLACEVYIYIEDGQIVRHLEFRGFCSTCVLLGTKTPRGKKWGHHITLCRGRVPFSTLEGG